MPEIGKRLLKNVTDPQNDIIQRLTNDIETNEQYIISQSKAELQKSVTDQESKSLSNIKAEGTTQTDDIKKVVSEVQIETNKAKVSADEAANDNKFAVFVNSKGLLMCTYSTD